MRFNNSKIEPDNSPLRTVSKNSYYIYKNMSLSQRKESRGK